MIPLRFTTEINRLGELGWICEWNDTPSGLPENIRNRYPWLPEDYLEFVESVDECFNKSETRWILSPSDFDIREHHAFTHDEWERLSLASCEGNPELTSSVRRFWDEHIPFCLDVSDGYSFFALRVDDRSGIVVAGRGPQFEEVETVAGSFTTFLSQLS